MKLCKSCLSTLPFSDFYPNGDYYSARCRSCILDAKKKSTPDKRIKIKICKKCGKPGTTKDIFKSSGNQKCIDCTYVKRMCNGCGEEKEVRSGFGRKAVYCKFCVEKGRHVRKKSYVDKKLCLICRNEKELSHFYAARNGVRSSYCKSCYLARLKNLYIPKPPKVKTCLQCGKEKVIRGNFCSGSKHCIPCVSGGLDIHKKKVHKDDVDRIVCNSCGEEKHKTKFEFLKKGKRRSKCRECRTTPERREKMRAQRRRYKQTHNGKKRKRVSRLNYKQRKRGVSDGTVTTSFIKTLEKLTKKCPMCENKLGKYQIDHVIPLSKGGKHTSSNLQLLCPDCNLKKSNKILTLV